MKQVASYQVEIADPAVALAAVVHARPVDHPCRLTLELAPDPVRDAVLVDYGLSGVDRQEYVLLASHLQQHPAGNASGEYTGGSDNRIHRRSDNTAWWPADHCSRRASEGAAASRQLRASARPARDTSVPPICGKTSASTKP